jgi:hypothetical protein
VGRKLKMEDGKWTSQEQSDVLVVCISLPII